MSVIDARLAVEALDARLGDPYSPSNACSWEQLCRNDESGERPHDAEAILKEIGAGEAFVPFELNGSLFQLDHLGSLVRAVFRRDPALGLGFGVTSLMAAATIWTAGTTEQKERAAKLLIDGGQIAVAFHELSHGNDFGANEVMALSSESGFRLTGNKAFINNADRAELIVMHARTSETPVGHSLFLLDRTKMSLPPSDYCNTVGVHGCRLSNISLEDTAVTGSALIGPLGMGNSVALRAFQVTRACLPSMAIGAVDTALRTTAEFAVDRRLYGFSVAELPYVQQSLAGVFADLVASDIFSSTVARLLHIEPNQGSLYSAAVKFLVPEILREDINILADVLGARFYLRNGKHSIFQKIMRDFPALVIGHAAQDVCEATLRAQLPVGVRIEDKPDEELQRAIFDWNVPLGPFDWTALQLGASGKSALFTALYTGIENHTSVDRELRAIFDELFNLSIWLRSTVMQMSPRERGLNGSALSSKATKVYARLLAASACINRSNVCRSGTQDPGSGLISSDAWLKIALYGILGYKRFLHTDLVEQLNPICYGEIYEELLSRLSLNTTFDSLATSMLPIYSNINNKIRV
ncbi:MAG: acyl-CoA dehydrogenase family protein [Firmicutes bacterium]|nr:acyl-CoA dehydrogenase family protein [Bacillota bacterium]